MNSNKRICAYINLESLKRNLVSIKQILQKDTRIMAVVKADGYGHGAVPIAKYIQTVDFIYGFAVATIEEGIALRDGGITKPVLILGYTFPEDFPELLKHDLSTAVVSYKMAFELSKEAARMKKTARVHIKVDTGMGRIGLAADQNAVSEIARISKLPGLQVEGIFTHFARADETDRAYTTDQLGKFQEIINGVKAAGVNTGLVHCSNSAGALDYRGANMDLVRIGIIMYGLWPSDQVTKELVELAPVLSLHSHVSFVKEVPAGTSLSYGGTFVTSRPSKIATVPVGYADGYPRTLSNNGYVLINGRRANIVGRICMDQFLVDVTGQDVNVGDRVVLVGKDGNETITMEMLGEKSLRFNYELACDLNQRIPRIYSK